MPEKQCKVHEGHTHAHTPGCGHVAVHHGDHVDYLHDGHLHHVHGDHVDDHTLEVSAAHPADCTPSHSCAGHPKVKSAFLVKWGKSDHQAKLYALLTDNSSLDVKLFEELGAAAKWLNVPATLLQPADNVGEGATISESKKYSAG